MSSSKQSRVAILSVLVILAFGTIVPSLVYAAPVASSAKDWQYVKGASWAQNYSPETQITKSNADKHHKKGPRPIKEISRGRPIDKSKPQVKGSTTPPI